MGTEPPPQKGAEFPNFGPMSIVTKRLDGLRWHLAWRWAFIGLGLIVLHGDPDPFLKKGAEPLNLRPIVIVPKLNGWRHQDAT